MPGASNLLAYIQGSKRELFSSRFGLSKLHKNRRHHHSPTTDLADARRRTLHPSSLPKRQSSLGRFPRQTFPSSFNNACVRAIFATAASTLHRSTDPTHLDHQHTYFFPAAFPVRHEYGQKLCPKRLKRESSALDWAAIGAKNSR